MAQLVIFIHGIGSNNEVWNSFLQTKRIDSDTKNFIEYQKNITNLEKGKSYYYLYEYKSKKLNTNFIKKFYLEKIRGIKTADALSMKEHKNSFISFIENISPNFSSIDIIAHSMGGIIVLHSILEFIESNNLVKNKMSNFLLYGSPLKGSNDPEYLENIISSKNTSEILKELKPNSLTITSLLQLIEKHKTELKNKHKVTFIAGDSDSRIIEISKEFIEEFATFRQISGGHSEIISPKNLADETFLIYKTCILKKNKILNADNDYKKLADKLLKNYISLKIDEFRSESNTLNTLHKDVFVNIFDMTNNSNLVNEENNLEYLYNLCKDKIPKFLLSNYGMGKSTIVKQLFQYINLKNEKKVLFIKLHLKELKHFYTISEENQFFKKIFTSKIFEEVFSSENEEKIPDIYKKDIYNYYHDLLKKGDLILIFDGLDEVNISSDKINDKTSLKNRELDNFLQTIYDSNYSIITTCRKEYNPFYNSFNYYKLKETYEIELLEWVDKQWIIYIEALIKNNPDNKHIDQFYKDIVAYKFADLPKRPLFLSMLTELVVFGNDISNINPKLKTNLSEIYNQYIEFSLHNDVSNKIQEIKYLITNHNQYINAWKNLLVRLAYIEYKNGKKITLNQIISLAKELDSNEKYYQKNIIENTLDSSSLFSIIHRDYKSNEFSFSHKSFLEYLIAYKLAENIFGENAEDSICNEAWEIYQTNEIHHHFIEEIVRVAYHKEIVVVSNDTTLDYMLLYENKYIETAFKKVLESFNIKKASNPSIMLELNEKYQAVLYYIGKFKIINLKSYLDEIIINQEKYNSVYFRTVSLSLSIIYEKTEYCDNYVLEIINTLLVDKNDVLFNENLNIQKKYHGSNPIKLRKRLEKNLQNYLDKNMVNNISLIVLTYFTTFNVTDKEILIFKDKLIEIKFIAEKDSYHTMIKLCEAIPKIWKIMIEKHLEELITKE